MAQVTVKTDIPQTVNYQSCTVQVGTTTTLASDQNATVTNAGTEYNAVLNFGIPRGKSAYEQAVEGGYQGTEEEFEQALASDIATVADNIEDVNTVATNISDIHTVVENVADVNTVATDISNVNTVAGISSDVSQVAGISSAVQTVSSHDSEVTLVSDNMASVMTTASNIGDVSTVAGISADVSTVADNNSNVTAVAGNSTNINAVAGNEANINAVNANKTNIDTVAGNNTNVTTVATNISNVNTAATNMAAIIAAPTAAQNAANSATNAQKWAEGTDSDVTPLGGTHSSKGWADVAKQYAESIGTALKYKGSVASYSALPSTGQEVGDMWNVLDTGKNYAWAGTEWDDLSGVVDLSAYRTAANQDIIDGNLSTAITNHTGNTSNPHSVTASQVGLGNVDNTSDLNKPISTATQTALNAKQDALVSGTNIKTVNGNSLLGSGNVDIDGLPTQTGQSGKFLTTDGSAASWSDKPLVNAATYPSSGLVIGGSDTGYTSLVAVGKSSKATLGGTAVGYNANAGVYGIAIGPYAKTTGPYAIQINSSTGEQANADANTFKVANQNGNFELMSADGTIPVARLNTMTGADGINAGTKGAVPAPAATDNTKFLKGDGTWANVDTSLPSQTGHSGEFLTTDGTNASWASIPTDVYSEDNLLAGKNINFRKENSVLLTTGGARTYAYTAQTFGLSTANSWSINIKYKVGTNGDTSSSAGRFILSNSNGYYTGPMILITTAGQFGIYMSSDGSSFNLASEKTWADLYATADHVYDISLRYDSTTGYTFYVKDLTSSVEWTKEVTSSTAHINNTSPLYFMNNMGNLDVSNAQGTMYLSNTTVLVDGVTVFDGAQAQVGTDITNNGLNIEYVTGAETYIDANELPSQTGQSGKYLTTDGTNVSWFDLAAEFNGKADLNLANINNAGKIVAAKASMPSGTYDDLTVGATGTTYTAPSDGYFCAIGYGTSNNMWVELINTSCGDYSQGVYGTVAWQYKVSLAAKKGDVVGLYYNYINFTSLRFIYAEGSKSEAA